jgi:hypothetical protein
MKIRCSRFNLYLCVALVLAFGLGCQTEERKRRHQPTTISIHIEVHPDGTNLSQPVPIYREHPFMINVDKQGVLSEANIAGASVVDVVGGFAIKLEFDRQGAEILEQRSVESRSQRFAVFCQWGPGLKESRWLAAPIIARRITDGVLVFTPDATREEAEQIVLGLNNIAREVKKHAW